ncbi:class I SAM-dependent methyltransferase [Pararhizobium sp. PWRC1-1]|uniref:class I SAM-dependent methyltransferase n=1 Tax=Pararhizobium sp. PWRC1-1 TaxID=2804566 RepID=UPI003CF93E62
MNNFEYIAEQLQKVEDAADVDDRIAVYRELRKLGINDFLGTLWRMPAMEYPRISGILPSMASIDVQSSWTGSSGPILMNQSVSFARAATFNYAEITGSSLKGKKILDFGCGYGRLLRAFAYFSDDVHGVDPWTESIRICHEAGLKDNVSISDYLPTSLPVPVNFDFVFAFSVFTHLSERATKQSLSTIRQHMRSGAVLCITVRPIEYWRAVYRDKTEAFFEAVEHAHRSVGFAFVPHHRDAIDGDITYGDTSMTIDYLLSIATDFKLASVDRSGDDEMQRYVYLKAI